jgi:hypothetical protein
LSAEARRFDAQGTRTQSNYCLADKRLRPVPIICHRETLPIYQQDDCCTKKGVGVDYVSYFRRSKKAKGNKAIISTFSIRKGHEFGLPP